MVIGMHPAELSSTKAVLVTVFEFDVLSTQLARLKAQQASEPAGNAAPVDPGAPGNGLADHIVLLENALRRSVIAHPDTYHPDNRGYALAAVGTTVEVHDGSRQCHYRLSLGVDVEDEGNVLAVSAFSPVGAALMGRAVGDTVDIALPSGRSRTLEVLRIVDDA